MSWVKRLATMSLLIILVFIPSAIVQAAYLASEVTSAQPGDKELMVGVSECLPFVMKGAASEFSGLSISLFEQIALKLQWKYRLVEYRWEDLLPAVQSGKIDLAVSCITITADREKSMDFSHAYFETNISVAVQKPDLIGSIKNILLSQWILKILLLLLAISMVLGGVIWLLERKQNTTLFPKRNRWGTLAEVLMSGLIFIVSGALSHDSYISLPARILAVIARIVNTILITGATAVVASALTSAMLSDKISNPEDLYRVQLAARPNTTSQEYLEANNMQYKSYQTDLEMLEALEKNQVDAVVQDAPLLQYLIKQGRKKGQFTHLDVLPWQLELQSYGFALPTDSQLREPLNRTLLQIRQDPNWENTVDSFLKED